MQHKQSCLDDKHYIDVKAVYADIPSGLPLLLRGCVAEHRGQVLLYKDSFFDLIFSQEAVGLEHFECAADDLLRRLHMLHLEDLGEGARLRHLVLQQVVHEDGREVVVVEEAGETPQEGLELLQTHYYNNNNIRIILK